jgi:hypothetical protein
VVATRLEWRDVARGWSLRWAIGRMRSALRAGLYAVGRPSPESPVLVTANYSLSFDHLRRELTGIDAWILVLDTRGINVWCAAGKGTFGTAELIHRIRATRLAEVVSHRVLILPQLGAPGVAAHTVTRGTGFRVVYGPVRASDLPAFLAAGLRATPAMRRVRFDLPDRLAVVPVELVHTWKLALPILAVLLLLRLPLDSGRTLAAVWDFIPFAGAILLGCVAVPALLPWIPGRSLAWKGALLGALGAAGWSLLNHFGPWSGVAEVLLVTPVASYLALNYTGATTYTSLSGVKRETAVALPAILVAFAAGVLLRVAGV